MKPNLAIIEEITKIEAQLDFLAGIDLAAKRVIGDISLSIYGICFSWHSEAGMPQSDTLLVAIAAKDELAARCEAINSDEVTAGCFGVTPKILSAELILPADAIQEMTELFNNISPADMLELFADLDAFEDIASISDDELMDNKMAILELVVKLLCNRNGYPKITFEAIA